MALFLKQSTAKVISFGPFLDKTDGVTEETGLVSALDHATTGIKLSKNGGALTIRHASVTATTYDAYGAYLVTLDTTDTNTLGTLRMAFNEAATCLPVWQDFMVLPANVYDSLVGGTDALDVSAIQLAGQTITAAAGVTFPTSVASPTNITAATGVTLTATTGLGNQTANITGNLSGSVGSVTGAVGSVTGAVGSVTGAVGSVTGAVGSVTGAVGSVTGSVGSVVGHTPQTGDSYARLGFPSNGSISADIANLPSAANNANLLLDLADAIDTGLTVRHALELAAGSVLNKLSGAGTGTEVVRNFSDTADLATVTVDVSGNKTAITYDFSI